MTKEFLVDIDGQRIPVTQSGNQLYVLDKKTNASLVELRPGLYSLVLKGKSHLIHMDGGPDPLMTINGQTVNSNIVSKRSELILRHGQQKGIQEVVSELRAPMPGLIMDIMVQVGEEVVQGQGLIVLEAMKMENELRAPCTGRVKHIHAQEKDAVALDAILMEFEP
ncbi:MAG: hypothetical protein OXI05_08250 [Bacteroidota bacterium]|nr:hypothetical protein [Bacteroidota bacterium]MXW15120.1 hypothetical protein [Rhodothermaceae bacterium]MDE2645813.1 hypothetical protein [Bacteroidota bacterium]MXW31887.1 hypothetical protein [Rhodothermaceae bacterium]MYC04768.1 hypothetical protein [Rhodothermaceae bacterium]